MQTKVTHLLFCREPIVVSRGHMDCEFGCASTRGYCFSETTHILHLNLSLDFLFMDVVYGGIGDRKHALL